MSLTIFDSSGRPKRTRKSLRWTLRLQVFCALACGVLLFAFSVWHGIQISDVYYTMELAVAWSLAALGVCSALYVLKRGHRKQRLAMVLALALIGVSLGVVTLLNRTPDPTLPSSRPPDL